MSNNQVRVLSVRRGMIDFLKFRKIALIFSATIIVSFFGMYIYWAQTDQEPLKFSVDFTGGTIARFKFDKEVSGSKLRTILDKAGWPGASIREFPEDNSILVRVQAFESDAIGLAGRIKDAISKALPDVNITITQSESVGKTIGATLRKDSIWAILLALLAMLIYIILRFRSLGFAMGAVIALFHDAIAILAVFMFFNLEISVNVIMAILAILGYSINDTIVIFTQIRKNLTQLRSASLYKIVNTSINQMLRRTLLTSLSTGLTVTALLVIGGETLRNLSIALLVGIIFGTYSSIYIACSTVMLIYKKA